MPIDAWAACRIRRRSRVAAPHHHHAALNMRRARRQTFLQLDEVPDVPVLDEAETHWSEAQRHRLAAALLRLSPEDRQLCDRRYHGRWGTARLAAAAGVDDAVMRKRLQRIRDRLRKEIEMTEQRGIGLDEIQTDLPDQVVELLARPRLTDLPENPVGKVTRPAARDLSGVPRAVVAGGGRHR